MPGRSAYDAVVVGGGPNGLAAAITIARSGRSVLVVEAAATVGGGARSAALTEPGFIHDVCSAVHPLAAGSPFFRTLPLADHGLEWVHPELPLAHPFEDGGAAVLHRSVDETARALGADGEAYRSLMAPLSARWWALAEATLGPLLRVPRSPWLLARFGLSALRSASALARRRFEEEPARALLAGLAAHSIVPLERPLTSASGLLLGAAGHAVGWPVARGGSGRVAQALASYLRSLGGVIETGREVRSLEELPPARAYLLDVTPQQLLTIAGQHLPAGYRSRLERFRRGGAAFKVDYALDAPIPWTAEACRRAGTVHVGGSLEEIERSGRAVGAGIAPDRPFVLVAQPTIVDDSRAPGGLHTAWAYCHVPNGCDVDMTDRVEAQIERFAPGFRARIRARHVLGPAALEAYNPNYLGGDIAGGAADGLQLIARPVLGRTPYRTPARGVYLCSASTPPGPGVHGMAGYWAARAVLAKELA